MRDRLGNDVPAEALPFAQWLEERGWHYLREYVPAGEYEDDDGTVVYYEAFWTESIWHELPTEWPLAEGDIWFFTMTVNDVTREALWPHYLDLAATASEHDRISCRVPFMYEAPPGWLEENVPEAHEGGRPAVSTPAPMNQPATEQEES